MGTAKKPCLSGVRYLVRLAILSVHGKFPGCKPIFQTLTLAYFSQLLGTFRALRRGIRHSQIGIPLSSGSR